MPKDPRDGTTPTFFPKPQKVPSPAQDLVDKLLRILQEHRKVFRRPALRTWLQDAKWALGQWSYQEVDQALDWYDAHMHDKFVPQVYGGRFFAEFPRILDAMKREQKEDTGW